MKRAIHILLFLFAAFVALSQTSQTCNLGFTFVISKNPNWGQHEPVVTNITPGSPADRAGLKINDIILEVNGNGTYLKPYATVMSWFALDDTAMSISIRNFSTSFKTLSIAKDCRVRNAITEAQLASVYGFYSLEDIQKRRFLMPLKTTMNPEAVFSNYQTFDFEPSSEETREIDDRINAVIERALEQRGLERDTEDPDFIIQTFYSYQDNPLFKNNRVSIEGYENVWRFDMRNSRMVKLPLYSPSEPVRIDDVAFEVEFGCRFYDRKFLQPGKSTLMWECEISERLKSNFGLEAYLEVNLPLMLLRFPYAGDSKTATFEVSHLKYNYTGIGYDMSDLKKIVSVDPGSPAYYADIRAGDVITKLQHLKFDYNLKTLTEGYRRFIAETMSLRDQATKYTDSNGFKECMFWNITKYSEVAKAISDKRYCSAFSYLFNFNQYIDWNTPSSVTFDVKRDGETLNFEIKPVIMQSTNISVL
ncbi:MAG: PDZ domain-containing protein [Dysgonamonadaceae bacterium]|jgi:hypothetical protein|nr:PDZ domain-containing protein [Dysgonamonadaceae bacterium]